MDIKAVLFDIDGTLYDREAAQSGILRIIVTYFPDLFSNLEFTHVVDAFAESDRILVAAFNAGEPSAKLRDARSHLFLRLLGLAEDYADAITETYVREYPHVRAAVPGAVEIVKSLCGKYLLGAVTNGLPDVQYRKLDTLGLRQHFGCIVLSEEFGLRKPDPAIFLRAAALLGVPSAVCLFVGDDYDLDVVGAKRAGMRACWLNLQAIAAPDSQWKPDWVVRDLSEVGELLAGRGADSC